MITQFLIDTAGVLTWVLPLCFLLASLSILYDIWHYRYTEKLIKLADEVNTRQTLRWRTFQNTTELQHECWYIFQLKNGSYIVEQYDEELNWRFYVPHTDYVTTYAQLTYGSK